jgi:hypothetical protein
MKKTKWFPADAKPVHRGVYETKSPLLDGKTGWFSYWDGGAWGSAYLSADFSFQNRKRMSPYQDREWRGLTEKAQ